MSITYLQSDVTVTTSPAALITLEEAKLHLRQPFDDEDTLIEALVSAATIAAMNFTGRSFISVSKRARYNALPDLLEVPSPPLRSVSSFRIHSEDGTSVVIPSDTYFIDTDRLFGTINKKRLSVYPDFGQDNTFVEVIYQSGYGNADDVPGPIKAAVLLLLTHLFENRGATTVGTIITSTPLGYKDLLAPYSVTQSR